MANLVQIIYGGIRWNSVKYNDFLIYLHIYFLETSPNRSDGSNDAKLRKDECTLWGPTVIYISPNSKVKSRKPPFYGVNFQDKPAHTKFAKISKQ